MTSEILNAAENYYKAMHNKDLASMASHLHPHVQFVGPLADMSGKDAVLAAAKNFLPFLNSLTIRAKFASGNRAMLAYDMECPEPIGSFRSATLFTFEDGLISRLELFYDGRPFEQKGIFTQK